MQDKQLQSFSQRLDAMTRRFHETGSLTEAVDDATAPAKPSGELDHDITALTGNVRHIVSLLDAAEDAFYARRHFA